MNLLNSLASREISGRDLAKLYQKEHGVEISYGSLYTLMRRLKDGGWVEMREDETADRRVRYFKISAPGARALHQLRTLQQHFGEGGVFA